MTELVVVCSITNKGCFDAILMKQGLSKIGVPYDLILTNPNLSLSESYNTIVVTHGDLLQKSKYVVFLSQDDYFEVDNWGKKLLETCPTLPNFGYGGGECKTLAGQSIGYEATRNLAEPKFVNVCDANMIIIPSWLFLEHQFDAQFKWYPFAEDYALWVRIMRGLNAYYVPLGCHSGGCSTPSKWVSQFRDYGEYTKQLRKDHNRLIRKWNLRNFHSTTWG